METILYFILLALIAEILGTVGGFGSSVFFVPIASLFFDFYSVLGITALFHVASNVSKIIIFHKGFNKRLILSMGVPAVLFVIFGAWLSQYINVGVVEILLSMILISTSLTLLFVKQFAIQPTLINSMGGGALSGILAGMLGTGGVIRGLTLAAFGLEKQVFIMTSAIIDLGIDFSRSLVYFSNGYIHRHDLHLVFWLILVSFVGSYCGKLILKRVSQEQFKKIVLVFILFTGVFILGQQILKWL
ncbi:MAG: sulfite exporter TauE/SafE family protein [Bacteroidetes bacterium]|nr:sulfite exporter TauE/SafE family protein [Bacteroidota bacterium]